MRRWRFLRDPIHNRNKALKSPFLTFNLFKIGLVVAEKLRLNMAQNRHINAICSRLDCSRWCYFPSLSKDNWELNQSFAPSGTLATNMILPSNRSRAILSHCREAVPRPEVASNILNYKKPTNYLGQAKRRPTKIRPKAVGGGIFGKCVFRLTLPSCPPPLASRNDFFRICSKLQELTTSILTTM